ncbi:recombinase zinc ribbon domain-containing protein [Lentzea nigeriaca]
MQPRQRASCTLKAAAPGGRRLVVCGRCGRRMDGHWVHGRAGYRCRHGFTSAKRRSEGEPRNLYVREDHLLEALPHLFVCADRWTRRRRCGRGAGRSSPRATPADSL